MKERPYSESEPPVFTPEEYEIMRSTPSWYIDLLVDWAHRAVVKGKLENWEVNNITKKEDVSPMFSFPLVREKAEEEATYKELVAAIQKKLEEAHYPTERSRELAKLYIEESKPKEMHEKTQKEIEKDNIAHEIRKSFSGDSN